MQAAKGKLLKEPSLADHHLPLKLRHILRQIIAMPQIRRPVTRRLLEEVQAEDEQHGEALDPAEQHITLPCRFGWSGTAGGFAVRIEDTSFVNRKSIELNPHVWVDIPKN